LDDDEKDYQSRNVPDAHVQRVLRLMLWVVMAFLSTHLGYPAIVLGVVWVVYVVGTLLKWWPDVKQMYEGFVTHPAKGMLFERKLK
jgi:hypothetical protein